MLVITKKDKRSPHDYVEGRTELLGCDDTIMLYSVRPANTVSTGHGATKTGPQLCNCIVSVSGDTNTNNNTRLDVNINNIIADTRQEFSCSG